MNMAEKAAALLELVSVGDLEAMRPAGRARFAAKLRRVADLIDRIEADRKAAKRGAPQ